jgi:hypothetical protein
MQIEFVRDIKWMELPFFRVTTPTSSPINVKVDLRQTESKKFFIGRFTFLLVNRNSVTTEGWVIEGGEPQFYGVVNNNDPENLRGVTARWSGKVFVYDFLWATVFADPENYNHLKTSLLRSKMRLEFATGANLRQWLEEASKPLLERAEDQRRDEILFQLGCGFAHPQMRSLVAGIRPDEGDEGMFLTGQVYDDTTKKDHFGALTTRDVFARNILLRQTN